MIMDPADASLCQKTKRKMLRLHLAKLHWPRLNVGGIRLIDFMHRHKSYYADWTNEDHFNLQNMSHFPTFQNPGFKELGMTLNAPLQAIHESASNFYVSRQNLFF